MHVRKERGMNTNDFPVILPSERLQQMQLRNAPLSYMRASHARTRHARFHRVATYPPSAPQDILSARIFGKSSPLLASSLQERSNATFHPGVNMEISYTPAAPFYRVTSKKQALSFLQDNSFLGIILRSVAVSREMIISLAQFPRVSELIFLIANEQV